MTDAIHLCHLAGGVAVDVVDIFFIFLIISGKSDKTSKAEADEGMMIIRQEKDNWREW